MRRFCLLLLLLLPSTYCAECNPFYVRWPRVKLNFKAVTNARQNLQACESACSLNEDPSLPGRKLECAALNHHKSPDNYSHECDVFQPHQLQNVDGYVEADDRYSFFWKYCLNSTRKCAGEYAFTYLSDRYMDSREVIRVSKKNSLEECLAECLEETKFPCRSISFNRTDGGCHFSSDSQLTKPGSVRLNNNPNFRIDYYESNCYNLSDTFHFEHECLADGIQVRVKSKFPYTGALYGLYDFFTCRVEPKEATDMELFFPANTISKNCSDSIRYKGNEMILDVVLSTDGVEPLYFITPDDMTYQAKCPIVHSNNKDDVLVTKTNIQRAETTKEIDASTHALFTMLSEEANTPEKTTVPLTTPTTTSTTSTTTTSPSTTTTTTAPTTTSTTPTPPPSTSTSTTTTTTTSKPSTSKQVDSSWLLLNELEMQQDDQTQQILREENGVLEIGLLASNISTVEDNNNNLMQNDSIVSLTSSSASESTLSPSTQTLSMFESDGSFVEMSEILNESNETTTTSLTSTTHLTSTPHIIHHHHSPTPASTLTSHPSTRHSLHRSKTTRRPLPTTTTSRPRRLLKSTKKVVKPRQQRIHPTLQKIQGFLSRGMTVEQIVHSHVLTKTDVMIIRALSNRKQRARVHAVPTHTVNNRRKQQKPKKSLARSSSLTVSRGVVHRKRMHERKSNSTNNLHHRSSALRSTPALPLRDVEGDIIAMLTKLGHLIDNLPANVEKPDKMIEQAKEIMKLRSRSTTTTVRPTTSTTRAPSTTTRTTRPSTTTTTTTTTTKSPLPPSFNHKQQAGPPAPSVGGKIRQPVSFDIYKDGRAVDAVVVGSKITLSFTPHYPIPPEYMSIRGCQVEPIDPKYEWEKEPLPIIKDACPADLVGLVCPPKHSEFGIKVTVESFRYQTTPQVQYSCLVRICPFAPCPTSSCHSVDGCPSDDRSKRALSLEEIRRALQQDPAMAREFGISPSILQTPPAQTVEQQLIALGGDHMVKRRLVVVNSEDQLRYYVNTGNLS